MAAGRNPSLMMGRDAETDRYISSLDAASGNPQGIAGLRWGHRGSGFDETEPGRTPREMAFRADLANPLYQRAASEMGITLNSPRDMTQIQSRIVRSEADQNQPSSQLSTDLANPDYQRAAQALGIKNFNSDNDVRQVRDYLARSGSSSSSSGGSMAKTPNTPNRFDFAEYDSQQASDAAGSLWNDAVLAKQRALRAQNEEVRPAQDGRPAVMGLRAQYGGYAYRPGGTPAEQDATFNGATSAALDYGYQQAHANNAMANYFDRNSKAQIAEAAGVMNSAIKRQSSLAPDAMSPDAIADLYDRYEARLRAI